MNGLILFFIILGVILFLFVIVIALYIKSKLKGKIKIQLDKFEFSPSDTVSGKIILNLKKPTQSKLLSVGILGIQKKVKYGGGISNRGASVSSRTSNEPVFEFNKKLIENKLFPAGQSSYDFTIKIPKDASSKNSIPGTLGGIATMAQALTMRSSSIKWYVRAFLDIKGFDISSRVQINIA